MLGFYKCLSTTYYAYTSHEGDVQFENDQNIV